MYMYISPAIFWSYSNLSLKFAMYQGTLNVAPRTAAAVCALRENIISR